MNLDDGTGEGAFIAITIIFLCIVVLLYASPADSQAPTFEGARLDRDAVLTGARLCVGETGWTDLDACIAQLFVIARRAAHRGVTFSHHARRYSRALRNPQPNRLWVPLLRDVPGLPPHWSGASWGAKRPLFSDLLRHVERVFVGEVPDTCPGATEFGGWMDSHRMEDHVRLCPEVDTTSPVQRSWGRR